MWRANCICAVYKNNIFQHQDHKKVSWLDQRYANFVGLSLRAESIIPVIYKKTSKVLYITGKNVAITENNVKFDVTSPLPLLWIPLHKLTSASQTAMPTLDKHILYVDFGILFARISCIKKIKKELGWSCIFSEDWKLQGESAWIQIALTSNTKELCE